MSRTAETLSTLLASAALGAFAGLVAHLLAGRDAPVAPALFEHDFHLARAAGDPLEVDDARSVTLPHAFGDFDLIADLELPAGGTLDVVLRLVEPRVLPGGDMPLFHGRFVTLRLSADGRSGPAFRSREQALFGGADGDAGQELAPGLPATIVVEARGRTLRANVAGVVHGPFEATDAHGGVAFVVRGGTALVHSLRIDPVARPLRLLPISWCAIVGAVCGVGAWLFAGRRTRRVAVALLALPAVAALWGSALVAQLLPSVEPEVAALVLVALAGVPLALGCAAVRGLRGGVAVGVLGLAAMVVAGEVFVRAERARLGPLEDPRLDAYFGARSGPAPLDALARRMRSRVAVHTAEPDGLRVVCLGGAPLYEASPDPAEWIAPIAAGRAGAALDADVECAVAATLYGHTRQQVAMFERFYLDRFGTRGLVLAIPPWEGEASEDPAAVAVLDGAPPPERGAVALVELWRRASAARVPAVAAPGELAAAVERLADLAAARGLGLAVIVPPDLDRALRDAVDAVVAARGLIGLTVPMLDAPAEAIEPLRGALVRVLGR